MNFLIRLKNAFIDFTSFLFLYLFYKPSLADQYKEIMKGFKPINVVPTIQPARVVTYTNYIYDPKYYCTVAEFEERVLEVEKISINILMDKGAPIEKYPYRVAFPGNRMLRDFLRIRILPRTDNYPVTIHKPDDFDYSDNSCLHKDLTVLSSDRAQPIFGGHDKFDICAQDCYYLCIEKKFVHAFKQKNNPAPKIL